ncbi:MAG: lipid-A-disaccharide synthase [Terriglobales bacterium]
MRLLVSAGEASGELYGAGLIEALRRRVPDLECFGVGGDAMRAAGCDTVVDARALSVVGITEIVSHLPGIYREYRRLLRAADERKPDATIVIDSPAFNFRVARAMHARGVPVIYYVCPQLWAWREGRVRRFHQWVRKALVIFPFEEKWYRDRGVDAEYVGHPLADAPPPGISREEFAAKYGPDSARPWVALLPGSRRKEIAMNLPALAEGGRRLQGEYEFVLPAASTVERPWLEASLRNSGLKVTVVEGASAALRHARAAVVASGTATVEAALAGTPMVVVYRVSALTWALGHRLLKVPYVAMPNLIAGEQVVPELIQSDFTPENVAARLEEILAEGPARERMKDALTAVSARLRPAGETGETGTTAERAAQTVLRALQTSK